MSEHYVPYAGKTCDVGLTKPDGGGVGSCYSQDAIQCPLKEIAKRLKFRQLDLAHPITEEEPKYPGYERPTEPVVSEEQLAESTKDLPLAVFPDHMMKDPFNHGPETVEGILYVCTRDYPVQDGETTITRHGRGMLFFAKQEDSE